MSCLWPSIDTGTGKTTYIAAQIERAVEKHGAENVIVSSFTKAAATELNRRNLPIPKENIGTLHALCYRALGNFKYEIAELKAQEFNEQYPEAEITVSGKSQMDEMAADMVFQTAGDEHLNVYNLWRAKCLPLHTMPGATINWVKKWEQWKSSNDYIDFTDMITITSTMKEPFPGRPLVGIYDEVQDFNRLELNLIRHWSQFQDHIILAGDDDQCHPAGTLIYTSNRGHVPIENLNPQKDTLWNFDKHGFQAYRAKSFRVGYREFNGIMVTVNNQLKSTYDHRLIARWNKKAIGVKAVYLMRKNNKWRIGITDLIRKRAKNIFGVGQRARQENADAAWILSIHDNPIQAMMMEEKLSMRYGISQMVFVAPTKGSLIRMTQQELNNYHDEISLSSRPFDLLADFGLSEKYPFWIPDGRQRGMTAWQEIRAINLFPCYMDVPTFQDDNICRTTKITRKTITSVLKEKQQCMVFSLDVIPYHTYIADGVIVHNCIYDFCGASPDAFINVKIPVENKRILQRSWRLPKKIHEFSQKWIKQVKKREPKEFNPREEEGSVSYINATYKEPGPAIELAERYARDGKTVMILASCGYVLATIKKQLRDAGLPFHNPYRATRGDWNPMGSFHRTRTKTISTRERILSFLSESAGTHKEYWSAADLMRWIEMVKVSNVLKRGAKDKIQDVIDNKRGYLFDEREFYREIFEEFALQKALSRDIEWFRANLLSTKRNAVDYPLTVYQKQGRKALEEKPKITIGTIHCSPGDELILTTEGEIPISKLDPQKHKLASYMSKCNRLVWGGQNSKKGLPRKNMGYPFIVAKNPYQGEMITIETDSSKTRITPTHRIQVRFSEKFFEKWVVYLMKRGDWWRVGICVSGHRPYKSGGIAGRLATEQADCAWILKVCCTREEAIYHESVIQGKFGIPGLTFEAAKSRSLSSETLHIIHENTKFEVNKRIDDLFNIFGIIKNEPLWTRQTNVVQKRNMRGMFLTVAANILDQYMEILVPEKSFIENRYGFKFSKKPTWKRVSVSKKYFSGDVYSLEVLPHHHYISGRAVVHNSVKGGEAQVVILCPDLSLAAAQEYRKFPDSVIRTFYVGMTRAKESLILCRPYSDLCVEL